MINIAFLGIKKRCWYGAVSINDTLRRSCPSLATMSLSHRYWLLPLIILALFPGIDSVPLFDVDEGAFSEATREMFERGDFISPYLNGEPRYDKPALIHWLQAASVSLFGWSELALRLPSVLATALWIWMIASFVASERTERAGRVTGVVMASSLLLLVVGRAATADAVLNLCLSGALLSTFRYFRTTESKYILLAYLFMGIGFLTKGPVALVIPGAVSLLLFLTAGRWREWLNAVLNLRGIALFLLIALPWYVVQIWKEGWPFIDGFFLHHNVNRFQGEFEGHGGSALYYLPVLLLGLLPHSGALVPILFRLRQIWADPLLRFALIWFLFVLLLFSIAGTKLPHYLLYGLPGIFILIGCRFEEINARGWLLASALPYLALLGALPWMVEQLRPTLTDDYLIALLAEAHTHFAPIYLPFFAFALAALILVALFGAKRDARLRDERLLWSSGLFAALGVGALLIPTIGQIQQAPWRDAALTARAQGWEVSVTQVRQPSFSYYYRAALPRRTPRPGEIVLTRIDRLDRLPAHQLLYADRGSVLVRIVE